MFRISTQTLEQVVGLVRLGIATYQDIKAAHASRALVITDVQGGREVTAGELDSAFSALLLKAFGVGDAAAARIEGRHVDQ